MIYNNTTDTRSLPALKSLAYGSAVALSAAALSANAGTITWDAGGDGVSTFQEANWVVTDDAGSATLNGLVGSDPPANFVDGAVDVEADVIVGGSATAGGAVGAGNQFDLGSGFSLLVQDDATFRMDIGSNRGIRGVSGGAAETLTIQDTADVITQFLLDITASMSGASTLTFDGTGVGTLNNSTLDLAADWTGTITWNQFDITGSSIFGNITVGGQAAVDGVNVQVTGDGSSSTLTVIPEPSSLALLALGGFAVASRRRA